VVRGTNDGSDARHPVTILSVARLVEKKGTDVLLDALARLPADLHWRLVHVGSGPLKREMRKRAQRLGIAGRITWRGALAQDELVLEYRKADLFALACRIARDGDRDGLPNVLAEAQSQGLACVATRVSAIPELIRDASTGVLVNEADTVAFAAALEALIRDPARRRSLGDAGQARLRAEFALEANLERLAVKFGLPARHEDRVLRTA
jgi:glycosyltransferase involved in cell wall biosynthesis